MPYSAVLSRPPGEELFPQRFTGGCIVNIVCSQLLPKLHCKMPWRKMEYIARKQGRKRTNATSGKSRFKLVDHYLLTKSLIALGHLAL
jgi:hypothetical protein